MQLLEVRWQQVEDLLSAYDFCLNALRCNTLEEITHFARSTSIDIAYETDAEWLDAWKRARSLVVKVSEDVLSICNEFTSVQISTVNSRLRDLIIIAEEQIFPLGQLINSIADQWSKAFDSMVEDTPMVDSTRKGKK
jgi:hypothetical protein